MYCGYLYWRNQWLLITALKDADKIHETWKLAQEKQKENKGFNRFKKDKLGLYSLSTLREMLEKTVSLKKSISHILIYMSLLPR